MHFYLLSVSANKTKLTSFVGLDAELYYVREGVINNYALNFVVPVPSKLDSLQFTWKSVADRPVSKLATVRYPSNLKLFCCSSCMR
jgi:hypothetical protein